MTNLHFYHLKTKNVAVVRKRALVVGRNRLLVFGVVVAFIFAVITGRLTELTILGDKNNSIKANSFKIERSIVKRSDIRDRNGIILGNKFALPPHFMLILSKYLMLKKQPLIYELFFQSLITICY